jgi:hypothetical protein
MRMPGTADRVLGGRGKEFRGLTNDENSPDVERGGSYVRAIE